MKKLLLLTILSSFFLVACGGDEGSAKAESPKEEIAVRLNLPEEPDMQVDEQTILGIDSNNNKINDHVERLIGFALPNDEHARNVYNRQAELWTLMINSKDNHAELIKLYDEYMLVSKCLINGYIEEPDSLVYIRDEYFRTVDREIIMAEISNIVKYDYSKETIDSEKYYCERLK